MGMVEIRPKNFDRTIFGFDVCSFPQNNSTQAPLHIRKKKERKQKKNIMINFINATESFHKSFGCVMSVYICLWLWFIDRART